MKTIIVPIDFSSESLNGLELAILFANHMNSDIQMVHVMKKEENVYREKEVLEFHEVAHNFNELIKTYKKKLGGECEITYHIRYGKIHEEVINQTDSFDDSMIVCSTHGHSGFEEFFIGSNAYKIASASPVPVITIRGSKIPKAVKRIILPLDNTLETREKVPLTAKLALRFNAEVHVLTLFTSDFENIHHKINQYTTQVCNYLGRLGIPHKKVQLQGNNVTDMTIDYANKVAADMISIMTEQEKSLSNLLLGNYAHQMINKSTIPVLAFPTRQIGVITESFKTEGIYYN